MWLLILPFIGAAFLLMNKAEAQESMGEKTNLVLGLSDIDPSIQGGSYSKEFDAPLKAGADKANIPFALLKAHAIRESSLKSGAHNDENAAGDSYGLCQLYWGTGSSLKDRFSKYGYSSDVLQNGSRLYDPYINCEIAAKLIADNLRSTGNLRDAVNMYNTGKTEAKFKAPHNYVDDVLKYYSTIIKRSVS